MSYHGDDKEGTPLIGKLTMNPSAPPYTMVAPTAVVVEGFEMKDYGVKSVRPIDDDDSSDEEGDPHQMALKLSSEYDREILHSNVGGQQMVADEIHVAHVSSAQGLADANHINRQIETSNQRIIEGKQMKLKIKSKVANATRAEDIDLLNAIDSKDDINTAAERYVGGDAKKPLKEDINTAADEFLRGGKGAAGGYKISSYQSDFDVKDADSSNEPKGYKVSTYKSQYD